MFNPKLFNEAVKASGLKKRYISNGLGMGYDTFVKKCNGHISWKVEEVSKVTKLLSLSARKRDAIFFAPDVQK